MAMTFDEIEQLEVLAEGAPFYVADGDAFCANFDGLARAFTGCYEKLVLAYSYKTNYIPYLCGLIRQKGGWAEVVSRMEYDLAVRVGQRPQTIIFNGPVKHYEDIALALDNGSIVNLDSEYEIDHVLRYAGLNADKEVRIGLRINIGLSDERGVSHVQNSLKVGRFGFDPASANLERIVARLGQCGNIKVISLHGHTSTTDRSVWCYEVITKTLCRIAETYFAELIEYINVGGGFFGVMHPDMPFKDTPTFEDYAKVICDVLKASDWVQKVQPTLVIEPGVAMVANVLSFVTKVVSVKQIQDSTFVTVDGSAFNTKPTFHNLNLPHKMITRDENRQPRTFSVVGATCMEKDYLLKDITARLPQVGDYIMIESIGAYTVVFTPPFINPAPAILAKQGDNYKLIRKKQTLDEIFSNYFFSF